MKQQRASRLLHNTIAMRESSSTSLLDGTLPLRPFHPDGFVGTMQADGQQVRVAALACDETRVVALSLVGFDTSIGVVFSRLWSSTAVPFTPADNWQDEWTGPEKLARSGERYKQCVAHLEGTREVHALALVRTAHLTEGILHPPDLPEMQKPSDAPEQEQDQAPASRSLPAQDFHQPIGHGRLQPGGTLHVTGAHQSNSFRPAHALGLVRGGPPLENGLHDI